MGKIRNLKELKPKLFEENNDENMIIWSNKNLEDGLDPEKLVLKVDDKIWIEGSVCRHSFKRRLADVLSTTKNDGCPYCSGHKVLKGFNDFETYCKKNNKQYLLDEWDYELNKKLPSEYSWSSGQQVHWIVRDIKYNKKFELKWEAPIDRRINGANCPYLSNQKIMAGYNDLATWCKYNDKEYLIKEWDDYTAIDTYSPFSNREVVWKCVKCGNTWKATPNVRANQTCDCPYCSNPPRKIKAGFNDFITWSEKNKPEILNYLDNEKNEEENIDLTKLFPYSRKKVNLICPDCGYKWKGKLEKLVAGRRCPCCSGKIVVSGINDFETKCKERNMEFLLSEWDYEKNEIKPNETLIGTKYKYHWICSECGYKWKSLIANRLKYKGCPKCASSKGEKRISLFLDDKKINYISEYTFNDCLYKAKLRFDFAVFKEEKLVLLIEYDGEGHVHPITFGGCSQEEAITALKETKNRDKIKNKYCKSNNIPLLRIDYTDFNRIEEILHKKFKELGIIP